MIRRASLTVIVVTIVLGTACKDAFAWRHAAEFRSGLRCGMQLDEVVALAKRLGAERTRPTDGTTHEVVARNTRFLLSFSSDRLTSVQELRLFGATGIDKSVRRDLCSGAVEGDFMLRIVAPLALSGAYVSIDDKQGYVLSDGPIPQLHVGQLPAGVHTVAIDKAGYAVIRRSVSYQPSGYWMTDNKVRLTIGANELQPN